MEFSLPRLIELVKQNLLCYISFSGEHLRIYLIWRFFFQTREKMTMIVKYLHIGFIKIGFLLKLRVKIDYQTKKLS